MEMRWFGAILAVVSSGSFGLQMAFAYRKEVQMLRTLLFLIGDLESVLESVSPPLPELCRDVGGRTAGQPGKVMLQMADYLDEQRSPDAYGCMCQVLQTVHIPYPGVRRILLLLGQNLGLYDLPGQMRGLANIRKLTEHLLEEKQRELPARIQNYRILGFCAGAAAAIALL